MNLRARLAWTGAISAMVGAVACGGTDFAAGSSDAADDSSSMSHHDGSHPGNETGSPTRDGGKKDGGKDGSGKVDGGHLPDGGAPDHTAPDDAPGVDATKEDAKKDAIVSDAPVGAKDAGPGCATKVAVEGSGIFLMSSTTPATSGCGALANPCTDLASAIAATTSVHSMIYIGQGTYTPAAPATTFPQLKDGTTIQGGWTETGDSTNGYTYAPVCAVNAIIQSSASSVLTVGNAGAPSAGTVKLDTINIENTATAAAGESLYGILAVGTPGASSLALNDVSVTVPSAGTGLAGGIGSTGADGKAGGCMPTSAGAVGGDGLTGPYGVYGPGGYSPASVGAVLGGPGGTGATPAETQTCEMVLNHTCGVLTGTTCSLMVTQEMLCSGFTESGCGGGGGGGGPSGEGGGSSIALYLWNEAAVIHGGSLAAGTGGGGGKGGTGGAGGTGASGGPLGAPSPEYANSCSAGMCAQVFTTIPAPPGTTGGGGILGGPGGGGAGGDSYAYYAGPAGSAPTVTIDGSPAFTPSSSGTGGSGGPPNGKPGYSGETNTQD